MKLHELNTLLAGLPDYALLLKLPGGEEVPVSFHITEVGQVTRDFFDCGGTRRKEITCLLQAWIGPDDAHRLKAGKLARILRTASVLFTRADLPVLIEYEAGVVSQYPVERVETETGKRIILHLGLRHTDCLAKDVCLLPGLPTAVAAGCGCGEGLCGPAGGDQTGA